MSSEPTPRPTASRWPLLGLLGAALLLAFAATAPDPDLWGHLRFGQDILAHGGVVRTDPYSYLTHPGTWINHEWLAEVSFALAYGALGVRGLVALKALAGVAAVGLVYASVRRSGAPGLGATLAGLLAAVAVAPALLTVRPQLYTVALMAALLVTLVAHERGQRGVLWAVAPIMALWVNCHGGVLAGAGLLLAWYGVRLIERAWRLRAWRSWLAILAPAELGAVLAGLLVTLANPYGVGLPAFLLRTATGARVDIVDWQPATLTSYPGLLYLLLLATTLLAYTCGRPRPSWSLTAVLAALALVSLSAQRHVPLYGLGVAIIAVPSLTALLPARAASSTSPNRVMRAALLLATALVLILAARVSGAIHYATSKYPAAAMQLLKARAPQANLLLPYGWGEYALWHAGPGVQVAMDGRRETVYDEAAYREHLAWYYGRAGWAMPVDLPATDLVLARVGDPPDSLMRLKPGWALVYEDQTAALYAHEGSALAAALRAGAEEMVALPETLVFP